MFTPIGVAVDPDALRAHAHRIKTALRYADLSPEKAALWMEIDPAQFRRQLDGNGHISLTRLIKLPVAFHQWYCLLMLEDVGVPSAVKRAMRVQVALRARKRMAKARGESAQKESVA